MEANENVSMKSSENRVVDALVKWSAEEARMKERFGADVINKKHYAQEKYNYYVDVLDKYGKTKDPSEKRYLNVMKGEMNELKKLAMPNKYLRLGHNAYKVLEALAKTMREAVKTLYTAVKKIATSASEYRKQSTDARIQQALIKEKNRQETIKRYEEAVKPLIDKNTGMMYGPDQRRNSTEIKNGEQRKVRHSFEDDLSLIPKKNSKSQPVKKAGESLLEKNREGTGKGVKL